MRALEEFRRRDFTDASLVFCLHRLEANPANIIVDELRRELFQRLGDAIWQEEKISIDMRYPWKLRRIIETTFSPLQGEPRGILSGIHTKISDALSDSVPCRIREAVCLVLEAYDAAELYKLHMKKGSFRKLEDNLDILAEHGEKMDFTIVMYENGIFIFYSGCRLKVLEGGKLIIVDKKNREVRIRRDALFAFDRFKIDLPNQPPASRSQTGIYV